RPTPAGEPPRRHPRRPGASPALPGAPLGSGSPTRESLAAAGFLVGLSPLAQPVRLQHDQPTPKEAGNEERTADLSQTRKRGSARGGRVPVGLRRVPGLSRRPALSRRRTPAADRDGYHRPPRRR